MTRFGLSSKSNATSPKSSRGSGAAQGVGVGGIRVMVGYRARGSRPLPRKISFRLASPRDRGS